MQIQNPFATEIIRREAGLTLAEGFPQNLTTNVVPVMDMTPSNHPVIFVANNNNNGTGSGTIVQTKQGVRFRVKGIIAQILKDSACDVADGAVQWQIVQNGVQISICSIPIHTLTEQSVSIAMNFGYGIECDVNTSIVLLSNSFTAGKMRRHITVFYEEIRT